jgi:hypothetical protein
MFGSSSGSHHGNAKGPSGRDDDHSETNSMRSAVSEGPALATTSAMQQHKLMAGFTHASPTKGKILLPSMTASGGEGGQLSAPSVNRWMMASPDGSKK